MDFPMFSYVFLCFSMFFWLIFPWIWHVNDRLRAGKALNSENAPGKERGTQPGFP